MVRFAFSLFPLFATIAACAGEAVVPGAARERITAEALHSHVKVLASDSFAGRAPSTIGEERTVHYLRDRLQQLGLKPGNGDSFFQEVPLVRSVVRPDAELTVRGDGRTLRFRYADEVVAWTKRQQSSVEISNSELVFVGYGIVAPEYGWDDYEGLDVRGKTVVILVNDPGFATQDTSLFRGNAMTYYGRWTYKFEEAARQGAEAALIVHETAPAAYGWDVVRNSWTGPQFSLVPPDGGASRVAIEGWITLETAQTMFAQSGRRYGELRDRAATREHRSVELGVTASMRLDQTLDRSTSRNVLALLPGAGRADEYIIYTAHWDHFGVDSVRFPDNPVFNGARDNATGTAALVVLAEAFAALGMRPSRSLLFLAVTAEERGLLGSEYYASNPVYPLAQTVAVLNMDAMNIFGPMNDITVVGYGASELDDFVDRAAAEQGRTVRPDPVPERGTYYRSDHFSFAKFGVPALYPKEGIDHVDHGEDWTREHVARHTAERYHQTTDEYDPSWDLRGMRDDVQLLFTVGYRLAQSRAWPNWREGEEFRAARDRMRGTR